MVEKKVAGQPVEHLAAVSLMSGMAVYFQECGYEKTTKIKKNKFKCILVLSSPTIDTEETLFPQYDTCYF